jgi:small subunit ribosomal protein S16
MLTIKLAKIGKKNKRMFRVIISEKSRDPYGRSLEILGSYNPYTKDLKVKSDRIKHWLSKGSSMTPSINNLLIENKIIEGDKVKNSKTGTPNKRKQEKEKKKEEPKEEKKEEAKTEEPKEEKKEEAKTEEPKEEKKEEVKEEESS